MRGKGRREACACRQRACCHPLHSCPVASMLVKPHHGENKGWGRPGEGMYFKGHQNRWLTKWEKLSTSLKSGKRLLSVGYITEHIYDSSQKAWDTGLIIMRPRMEPHTGCDSGGSTGCKADGHDQPLPAPLWNWGGSSVSVSAVCRRETNQSQA